MARLLWWYMLWLMRRPWMKRLQKAWLKFVPEGRRVRANDSLRSQNRWALKYGLRLLTGAMNFLIASMLVTILYLVAINLYEAGSFQVSKKTDTAMARSY